MAIDYRFVKLLNITDISVKFNLDELNDAFENGYVFEGEFIDMISKKSLNDYIYIKLVKYETNYDFKFTFDFVSPITTSLLYKNILPDKQEYKYVDIELYETNLKSGLIAIKKYSNDPNNYKIKSYKK